MGKCKLLGFYNVSSITPTCNWFDCLCPCYGFYMRNTYTLRKGSRCCGVLSRLFVYRQRSGSVLQAPPHHRCPCYTIEDCMANCKVFALEDRCKFIIFHYDNIDENCIIMNDEMDPTQGTATSEDKLCGAQHLIPVWEFGGAVTAMTA